MLLPFNWNFLFLFIGLVQADHIMQQAIKAFVEFHSVKCNILISTASNRLNVQRASLDFYKAAIKNNYIPTILKVLNVERRKKNSISAAMRCSKPLQSFIMGNVSYIAEYMIAEARKRDIRKDIWLLFLANDFDQKLVISEIVLSMRSEVYIARRTDNGYKFWEIYKPAKNNPVRIIYYGDWNPDKGLRATELTILKRRRDFGGVVLYTAILESEHRDNSQGHKHSELLRVISNLLQKELNFTVKTVTVSKNDSAYLTHEPPSTIIIRKIAKNEADMSMVGLVLESKSLSIIDYSAPVAQTDFRVYIKKTSIDTETGSHFAGSLPGEAWYSMLATVTALPLVLLFMHCIGNKAGLIKTQFNLLDLCITMHQMLCLQGGDLGRELYSISLVFVCFNLWAFLFRAMYSASLASSLAVEHYAAPFNSLEELLENGQYEFGVHRYSTAFDLYYNTDDIFIKKLNQAVMEKNISNLPETYLEGLQRVCSEKKYAFMINRLQVMELQSKISCKVHYLPHEKYTVSTSYAMTKHNEYLPFINRWLHTLKEAGLMEKLQHDILEVTPFDVVNDVQSFRSLSFENTIFLQVSVLAGVALSILLLFGEILYSRMRRNRRKSCLYVSKASGPFYE